MPSLFDLLSQAQQSGAAPQQPAPESTVGDEFHAGLRSGAMGVGANLEALAGDVGEAVGADDFATNRRRAMRDFATEAQQSAPRVSRMGDVHSLRDAVDFGAGMAGQMIPAGAAMVGGGLAGGALAGPAGAVAGSAAALTPIEAGDIAQRMQADPQAAATPVGERLMREGLGGAGSALLQTAVPGAIVGRVAGGVAGKVAGAGLRDAFEAAPVLPRAAGEMVAGTGGMVGGEATKQLATNPDKPLDTEALKDTAETGALGMLPLVGMGAAASAAGRGVRATGNGVARVADAAKGAVKDGAQAVGDAATSVAEKAGEKLADAKTATTDFARDPASAVRDAASAAKDIARDFWTKLSKGEETLTSEEAAQPDQQAAQAAHDEQRTSAVQDAYEQLLADKSLTPDVRRKLMAAGQDLGDRVNQAVVASVKLARDATQSFSNGIKRFASDVMGKADAQREGVMQSADESGLYKALQDEVIPVLQQHRPDLLLNDGVINDTAKALRNVIQRTVTGGEFSDAHVADLLETFGDATLPVMEASHRAVFGNGTQATDEAFFGLMNRLHDTQASHDNLVNVLRDSMQTKTTNDTDLSTLAWKLKDWARDYRADDTNVVAKKAYADKQVLRELNTMFGNKTDAVLDAVQKSNAEASDNVLSKGGSNAIKESDEGYDASKHAESLTEREAGGTATHYYGTGDDRMGLALNPEHPDFAGDKTKNQVSAALERAKADHPDKTVAFLTTDQLGGTHPAVKAKYAELVDKYKAAGMDEADAAKAAGSELKSGKHGMVVAEGEPTPGQITSQDVNKNLLLVQKKGDSREHPAGMRIETGMSTRVIDAMKLTRKMHEELPYDVADEKSKQHRMARMFMEGVASLSDRLGKAIDPADSTVIADFGSRDKNGRWKSVPFTYGEAKKLDFTPRNERAEKLNAKLEPLRKAYKEAMRDGDERRANDVLEEAQRTVQFDKDAELSMDPKGFDPAQFDKDGNITREGLRMLMEGDAHAGGDAGGRTRHTDSVNEELKTYTGPDITKRYLKDRGASQRAREAASTEGTGQREADPFGNIHMLGDAAEPIRSDAHGALPRGLPDKFAAQREALRTKLASAANGVKSKAGQGVIQRALDLVHNLEKLPQNARNAVAQAINSANTVSDMARIVNVAHERFAADFGKAVETAKPATETAKPAAPKFDVDTMVRKADYGAIKSKGEMDAFLTEAAKRYAELLKKGDARTDAEDSAYHHLHDLLADHGGFAQDLGMMYDGLDGGENTDASVRAMLAKSAPEVADRLVPKSLDRTRKGAMSDEAKTRVNEFLDKVLGSVKREFPELADMAHAGEYDSMKDLVRVSVHALDPMTVAYHESLHALFKRLRDQGNGKVASVLERVAMSDTVQRQMRELLKKSPEALKQLDTPEEAAAYMYQFHQAGVLKSIVPEAKTMLQRVAQMVKKMLGIWRDDERAQHIMDYFGAGEFKKNASDPNAVAQALLEKGHNQIIQKTREMTRPLLDVAQALAVGTGARLRASQSQSMRDVADLILRERHGKGADPGFIPAQRHRRTLEMNRIAEDLKDIPHEAMAEALEAMQSGQKAGLSADAQRVLDVVQGPDGVLPRMRAYMKAAGVDVSSFQPNPNYFPRVYDTNAISRNQEAFMDLLKKHGIPDARGVMNKITANEGNSFAVIDRPGMQFLKERKLRDIPDHELAPFMRKDLMSIMSSYVSQATRRAEWARRFGDDNHKFNVLIDQAKKEGASEKDIATAHDAMRAADGTLGDDMSPRMRRLQGNVLVYQNVRLLPLMIFSNAVDPMGIVVRGGKVSDAWAAYKRTFSEVRQAWKKEYKADAATRLAQQIGTIDDAALGHAMSDVYMQGMVGDKGKAVNSAFFRYNFTEATNRAMRVAATQAAIDFIERHATAPGEHSARYLNELGLEPDKVPLKDGKLDLTDDAAKAAVVRWVDGAVLRPEAMDTPLWMSDPHYMLLAHLKRFVYAFQETVLKRVMHEMKHGNYTPAMALASYVPIMIAADAAKGMILGGGAQPNWKQDWGPSDYIASGVQRAGLLGIGQFALDAAQGNLGSLSGPTIEQFVLDPIKLAYGRESARSYAEDAMPAHALYQGFVDPREAKADPAFSD